VSRRLSKICCAAGDSNRFLRLHNSYQHDLKIYSSDEGRVQTTAGTFASLNHSFCVPTWF
jgi:hypothetical protein